MKSAYITKHGDLDDITVGQLDDPEISHDEILVKGKFAALNHLDSFVVKGWKGLDLTFPHVLGSDGSGVVLQTGEAVSTIQEGDCILVNPGLSCMKCYQCLSGNQNLCSNFSIIGEHANGTFSTVFKIPEVNALKVPRTFPLDMAAAAPLTFLTAWRMLTSRAKVKQGQTVFIHGAGGGVATAAIQIAKAHGATVIATTSTPAKMEMARKLGADHIFNYKTNQVYDKEVYTNITKKKGVDIVIDSVGSPTFSRSLRLLRKDGILVTCGATAGQEATIDIRQIFWKQVRVLGSTMANQAEFRDAMNFILEGKGTPVISKVFSLDDIVEAERYLLSENSFGKVLVQIS